MATYRLDCDDCSLDERCDSEFEAAIRADTHAEETGHDVDYALLPESHLTKALEHVQAAQRECDGDLRDDELLVEAASAIGAARAYVEAARRAQEVGDG